MSEEKNLTELESLRIITEMMQKVKKDFYDTGISALMWGSVITFCGLFCFIGMQLKWGDWIFQVWNLTFLALIPQIFIAIRERKKVQAVYRPDESSVIWTVFAIAMFGLVFYTAVLEKVPSPSSLYLLMYIIPTLTTGLSRKFKPMIVGGLICLVCFVISPFTNFQYDCLLQAIAGAFCWLIPGIILHQRYQRSKQENV
jgi:hypothetical protein